MGFDDLPWDTPVSAFRHGCWDILSPGGWETDIPARIPFERLTLVGEKVRNG